MLITWSANGESRCRALVVTPFYPSMADLYNPGATSSQDQITLLRAIVGRINLAEDRVAFCIIKQLLIERIAELEAESAQAQPAYI